ncbi:AP-4 complex subunit epsilon [Acorus calamus]|uniref:AP-4 complex subunit epsilon n=1 Tax=Acorus calamus TaxID=4465 RepID=A0AAV9F4U7_ACOCL|nr:AP-4 complex subunit epsilon [Acorus calamus]
MGVLRVGTLGPRRLGCATTRVSVICWVLGEYGTTDGKYSASYITEKLCDAAEAHSNDNTFKEKRFPIALMKTTIMERSPRYLIGNSMAIQFNLDARAAISSKGILIPTN